MRREDKRQSFGNISSKEDLIDHYNEVELLEIQKRVTENITLIKKEIKSAEASKILVCLKNHFIFYNLTQPEIQNVKDKMYFCEVEEGDMIYDEAINGTCFFILDKGLLEITTEGSKKILKPQDGFGELALLYNTKRNSSVKALQSSKLWVIDRLTFREAVEEMIIREYNQNKKCLEGVRFFSSLTSDIKDIIASSLIRQKFYKNQTIIQEGDPGSSFFYIKEGNASVFKGAKFIRKLTKGDSFGEQSLYYNTMRQLTIKADEDVICLVLGRDTLNRILGDRIFDVTFKNFIRWAFEKNPIINKLSKDIQERIIDEMKISSFKAQQSIFKRGVSGFQKLVVVIEGSLKKLKSNTVVATKSQCFGEDFFLEENKNKILEDEIVMQTYGVIAEISDSTFYEALGQKTYKELISQKEERKLYSRVNIDNQIRNEVKNLKLSDFEVTHELSVNSQFGPLFLLRDHKNNNFVLKTMRKKELQEYQVQQFVVDEAKVFEKISFPFVLAMGQKFQTDNHVFYINEYVKGIQFYQALKSIGLLSTEDSQFYTATIILILEYFESIFVICRDIKPQNFLVDHNGYLKLINLPTAKVCAPDNNNNFSKTYTIIGTPHYMAPDIVIGKGYNNLVDLWSLGVNLYQYLCGYLPFGDSSESAYEIYQSIMQSQIKFPQFLHDKKAKKLIEQLLNHNPSQRHGGSFATLKNHPWFQKFNWDDLIDKHKTRLPPPFIPPVKGLQKLRDLKQNHQKLKGLIFDLQNSDKNAFKPEFDWSEFGETYENK